MLADDLGVKHRDAAGRGEEQEGVGNRVELSAERRGGVERTRKAAVHDVADQAGDENRHEDIAVPHDGQPGENGNRGNAQRGQGVGQVLKHYR